MIASDRAILHATAMQARKALLVLLGVSSLAAALAEQPALYSASVYSAMNYNGHQW